MRYARAAGRLAFGSVLLLVSTVSAHAQQVWVQSSIQLNQGGGTATATCTTTTSATNQQSGLYSQTTVDGYQLGLQCTLTGDDGTSIAAPVSDPSAPQNGVACTAGVNSTPTLPPPPTITSTGPASVNYGVASGPGFVTCSIPFTVTSGTHYKLQATHYLSFYTAPLC